MCITKLGSQNLNQYIGSGAQKLWGFFKRLPKTAPVTTGKAVGRVAVGVVSAIAKPLVKGVAGAGKFIWKHPAVAIPAISLGALAAHGFHKNLYKNMYNVDPKYNITRSNAFGQIVYKDPSKEEQYKNLSLFNV